MKLLMQTVILSAMFLAGFVGAIAGEVKPGDKVAAKWIDGNYYLATVTEVGDGKLNVLYDDGDQGTVAPAEVIGVVRDAKFNVGDHVLAAWKTAAMFPGVVTAKTQFTVTVTWDDGDTPLEVAKDRVVALKAEAAPVRRVGELQVGTVVAAKWNRNYFYIATIARVDARDGYFVNYGDGDSGWVAVGDVVPVNATQEIPVGAHVLACWQGAQMFPGVVTKRSGNVYTVKWDDGDEPLEVNRVEIAPLGSK